MEIFLKLLRQIESKLPKLVIIASTVDFYFLATVRVFLSQAIDTDSGKQIKEDFIVKI